MSEYIQKGRKLKTVLLNQKQTRGLRPPRKIIPPRTPKFDLGGMEQKSLTQEDVRQWVKEQNALGHKTKYIPAQTTLRDKDESPQETKGGEQRSFRKEERTPRKQANPRKLRVKENDAQNLKPVPCTNDE